MTEKKTWKRRSADKGPRQDKGASCPFCRTPLERPHRTDRTRQTGFVGGRCCSCGAVFVFDENGIHGGEAIVEVMTMGCDGDWDLAWSLIPDVDYRQIVVSYDPVSHRISETGDAYEPEGKLYFFLRQSLTDDRTSGENPPDEQPPEGPVRNE